MCTSPSTCRTCCIFARPSWTRLGIVQKKLRSLDGLAGSSARVSLEDRNRKLVESCFFQESFGIVREEQQRSGVQYLAETTRMLRNEDLVLVDKLEPGFAQFFDPDAMAGPNTRSFWVAAEGWFYVLSYSVLAVGQSKYTTPTWVLEALWLA